MWVVCKGEWAVKVTDRREVMSDVMGDEQKFWFEWSGVEWITFYSGVSPEQEEPCVVTVDPQSKKRKANSKFNGEHSIRYSPLLLKR